MINTNMRNFVNLPKKAVGFSGENIMTIRHGNNRSAIHLTKDQPVIINQKPGKKPVVSFPVDDASINNTDYTSIAWRIGSALNRGCSISYKDGKFREQNKPYTLKNAYTSESVVADCFMKK